MPNPWFQEESTKLQLAKEDLHATGLFKEIWEMNGWCPVQCEGLLSNGDWFYFRSRNDMASLEIAREPWTEPYLATFEDVTPRQKHAAGYIEADRTKELILRWVMCYLDLSITNGNDA